MKFVLIPKSISWLSILATILVSFILIGIGIPTGGGREMGWLAQSSLALFGVLSVLSLYEKKIENEKKAAVFSIMNATLLFWWIPIGLLVWKVATKV